MIGLNMINNKQGSRADLTPCQVAGLDEIKQWVMSLGPEAEVIEPKRLRELIRQDLKKTLSKYERGVNKTLMIQNQKINRIRGVRG